jgi:ribosomal protein S18 acetylase RimI-like enzyme
MPDTIEIRKIGINNPLQEQVFQLREAVLRRPLGLSLYHEDLSGDAEDDTFVALQHNRVIGCLMRKPLPGGTAKLRQMAVSPECQSQGIGRLLMEVAEQDARESGYQRISLHARKQVAGFYTQLGYESSGEEFEEVTIPHLLMSKEL